MFLRKRKQRYKASVLTYFWEKNAGKLRFSTNWIKETKHLNVYLHFLTVCSTSAVLVFCFLFTGIDDIAQVTEVAHHRPDKLSSCEHNTRFWFYELAHHILHQSYGVKCNGRREYCITYLLGHLF